MGEECKVNPMYNENRHRRKHSIKRFLILAGTLVLIALVLLALITFITWLVLRPIHSPSWVVDDVQVLTLNVQSTTSRRRLTELESPSAKKWGIITYFLNADIVVTLRASNRNRHMEVIYDRIDMKVAYATAVFGRVMYLGFVQEKANVTLVQTEMKAMSVPVSYILGNALQGDIRGGSIDLEIYVDVRARVRIGGYRSFGFGVKNACEVTTSTPDSGRAGQLITKKCHRS